MTVSAASGEMQSAASGREADNRAMPPAEGWPAAIAGVL
jgi:hypothetical protein